MRRTALTALALVAAIALATALAAMPACGGVDNCSAVCDQHAGAWQAKTTCTTPELADLHFNLNVGVSAGQCRLVASYCEKTDQKQKTGAHDCESELTSFAIGIASCAVRINQGEPTATCRANGHTCEYTFKRDAPPLACALPKDAGGS